MIVVFNAKRKSQITVSARIAANGPGIDAMFRLYDTNDPSAKVELPPHKQEGVSASWALTPAVLAAVPGPIDHLALWLANLSQYQGSIELWLEMAQNGAPLGAFGSNGKPLTPNANGEFQLDTLAYGTNDTCPVFIKFV